MIDVHTIYIYMYDFPPQTLYNLIYFIFSSKIGIGNVIFSFYENFVYFFFILISKVITIVSRCIDTAYDRRNLLYIVWLLLEDNVRQLCGRKEYYKKLSARFPH